MQITKEKVVGCFQAKLKRKTVVFNQLFTALIQETRFVMGAETEFMGGRGGHVPPNFCTGGT